MDYEECSLVGYTECTTDETSQELRDDQVARKEFPSVFDQLIHQVGGEAFIQRTCGTKPITIIELKEKPECEKVEKVIGAVQIFNMQDPNPKIWLLQLSLKIRKCVKRCGFLRRRFGRTPTASKYSLEIFFLKDVWQSSRAGPLRVCAQPFEHNPRLLRV